MSTCQTLLKWFNNYGVSTNTEMVTMIGSESENSRADRSQWNQLLGKVRSTVQDVMHKPSVTSSGGVPPITTLTVVKPESRALTVINHGVTKFMSLDRQMKFIVVVWPCILIKFAIDHGLTKYLTKSARLALLRILIALRNKYFNLRDRLVTLALRSALLKA